MEKILNTRMRILVISQYFWPENFRINDLVNELSIRGHELTVLTGYPNYPNGDFYSCFADNPNSYKSFNGVEVVRVPIAPRKASKLNLVFNYLTFALSASTIGAWKLRGRYFDVIFVYEPSPVTVGIPAVVLRYIKKAPIIFWVLDLWPDTLHAVGVIKSKISLYLIGILVRFIYCHCDLILAQSNSFISKIRKYSKSDSRIEYFPSWSEIEFNLEKTNFANEIDFRPNSFNILFAGNIGEAQDFPAILEAAELLKSYPNIQWLILGSGRMAGWVKEQILQKKLQDSVRLLGPYPIERMPSFFKHADALLLPLRNDKIFSMTIPAKTQTYFASGLPLLVMANGEVMNLVQRSKSGLVCSAGDSKNLSRIALDLSRMGVVDRAKLGLNGLILSRTEFSRDKLIRQLESWLISLGNFQKEASSDPKEEK